MVHTALSIHHCYYHSAQIEVPSIVISMSVCLYAGISQKPHIKTSLNLSCSHHLWTTNVFTDLVNYSHAHQSLSPALYLRCAKYLICYLVWVRTPENGVCFREIPTQHRSLYSAPASKFHNPMLNRLEVTVFTNKQTKRFADRNETLSVINLPQSIHITAQPITTVVQLL